MSDHAKLRPSAAARWVKCPASVDMEAAYPGDESASAAEGTAAHWVASEMLAGHPVALGQVAPNGVVIDDEMIEGAEIYVAAVRKFRGVLHVEKRVAIPYVHAECFGTPDAWSYDADGATLYIADLKFGHGYVDVLENWQLIAYASGILDALGIDGHADRRITVEFVIVQPRHYSDVGPVRIWRVMASALRPYFNQLQAAAEEAMRPYARHVVSVECRHCTGRHACTALQRAALDACDVAKYVPPVELPVDAIGLELRILQRAAAMLSARMTGLEELALSSIRKGANVPGFRLAYGKGRKRWSRPVEEIVTMAKLMDVDVAKSLAAITPAQAIKAGLPADLVDAFSETPSGAAKLEVDDGTLARRVFG